MRRIVRSALMGGFLVSLASAIALSSTQVALAGCHHFTVTANPTSVLEGGAVMVTVSRDNKLAPSHVDVSTVDETAIAGRDYQALHRTVAFTNDTQQTFAVQTLDDPDTSATSETFKVHLSNPGGCAINPNFIVDPDASVTIQDPDAAQAVPTPAAPALAASPSPSLAPSPSPSSAVASSPSSGGGGGGGGGSPLPLIIGIVVLAALGGAGYYLWRKRRA